MQCETNLSEMSTLNAGFVNDVINEMITFLYNNLADEVYFPPKEERDLNSVMIFEKKLCVVVDGSEQQCTKATNPQIQDAHYSGKKKLFTITKCIGASPKGHIYYISGMLVC